MALVWQENEPGDTRIGYAVYDRATGMWGAARTVASSSTGLTGCGR